MALSEHVKFMFSDAVQELAGGPDRSLLKALVGHDNKKGQIVYLDGIGRSAAARTTLASATKTRRRFEGTDQGVDHWVEMQTPHCEVARQRTVCLPSCIDWGFHFEKEQEVLEAASPQSQTLRIGMQEIFYAEDALILTALLASVTRAAQTGPGAAMTTSTVVFDTTNHQIATVADSTATNPKVIKDLFALIKEKFEKQYVKGERIILVCSTRFKRELIINSGGTLMSKDFVDSGRYFATGELPDIYGLSVLPHPQLDVAATGADEHAIAFTQYGLTWNQFDPLVTNLAVDPGQRFHAVAYLEQYAGASRVDDGRVVDVLVDRTP